MSMHVKTLKFYTCLKIESFQKPIFNSPNCWKPPKIKPSKNHPQMENKEKGGKGLCMLEYILLKGYRVMF